MPDGRRKHFHEFDFHEARLGFFGEQRDKLSRGLLQLQGVRTSGHSLAAFMGCFGPAELPEVALHLQTDHGVSHGVRYAYVSRIGYANGLDGHEIAYEVFSQEPRLVLPTKPVRTILHPDQHYYVSRLMLQFAFTSEHARSLTTRMTEFWADQDFLDGAWSLAEVRRQHNIANRERWRQIMEKDTVQPYQVTHFLA